MFSQHSSTSKIVDPDNFIASAGDEYGTTFDGYENIHNQIFNYSTITSLGDLSDNVELPITSPINAGIIESQLSYDLGYTVDYTDEIHTTESYIQFSEDTLITEGNWSSIFDLSKNEQIQDYDLNGENSILVPANEKLYFKIITFDETTTITASRKFFGNSFKDDSTSIISNFEFIGKDTLTEMLTSVNDSNIKFTSVLDASGRDLSMNFLSDRNVINNGIEFNGNNAAITYNSPFTISSQGISLVYFFKPRSPDSYLDEEIIFSCSQFKIRKGLPAMGDSNGFHILIEDHNGNLYRRYSECWQRYIWNALVITIKNNVFELYSNNFSDNEPILKVGF